METMYGKFITNAIFTTDGVKALFKAYPHCVPRGINPEDFDLENDFDLNHDLFDAISICVAQEMGISWDYIGWFRHRIPEGMLPQFCDIDDDTFASIGIVCNGDPFKFASEIDTHNEEELEEAIIKVVDIATENTWTPSWFCGNIELPENEEDC